MSHIPSLPQGAYSVSSEKQWVGCRLYTDDFTHCHYLDLWKVPLRLILTSSLPFSGYFNKNLKNNPRSHRVLASWYILHLYVLFYSRWQTLTSYSLQVQIISWGLSTALRQNTTMIMGHGQQWQHLCTQRARKSILVLLCLNTLDFPLRQSMAMSGISTSPTAHPPMRTWVLQTLWWWITSSTRRTLTIPWVHSQSNQEPTRAFLNSLLPIQIPHCRHRMVPLVWVHPLLQRVLPSPSCLRLHWVKWTICSRTPRLQLWMYVIFIHSFHFIEFVSIA